MVYKENPKDVTKQLLELRNKFSKIVSSKINIQKSAVLLYTNVKLQKVKLREYIISN